MKNYIFEFLCKHINSLEFAELRNLPQNALVWKYLRIEFSNQSPIRQALQSI